MVKQSGQIFFLFVTIHAFDRRTHGQTDTQTEFLSLYRVCISCSEVNIKFISSTFVCV